MASVVFHNQAAEQKGPGMKIRKPSSRNGDRVPRRAKEGDHVPINVRVAARKNTILAALPGSEFDRLVSKLEPIQLKLNEVLYLPGELINHVYFLTDGIISLLTILEDGTTIEAAVVGSEGMVGLSVIMGVEKATNEALVQAEGLALRSGAARLVDELHTLIAHYVVPECCLQSNAYGGRTSGALDVIDS